MEKEYLYDFSIMPEWPLSEQAATIARMRKALAWYANPETYRCGHDLMARSDIGIDCGALARKALEGK